MPNNLMDRIENRLKNNKAIVVILFLSLIVGGIAGFLKNIKEIGEVIGLNSTNIQVSAEIQEFDILTESIKPPHRLISINGNIDNINDIANKITSNIVDIIQPNMQFKTELSIDGDSIKSNMPIYAYFYIGTNAQSGPMRIEVGGEDVLRITDFLLLGTNRNKKFPLTFAISDQGGGFSKESITIYKSNNKMSFAENEEKRSIEINLSPRETKILLNHFNISSQNTSSTATIAQELYQAMLDSIKHYEFIQISPMSHADLLRKRNELLALKAGYAKYKMVEQYNVDYIIGGDIIAK